MLELLCDDRPCRVAHWVFSEMEKKHDKPKRRCDNCGAERHGVGSIGSPQPLKKLGTSAVGGPLDLHIAWRSPYRRSGWPMRLVLRLRESNRKMEDRLHELFPSRHLLI